MSTVFTDESGTTPVFEIVPGGRLRHVPLAAPASWRPVHGTEVQLQQRSLYQRFPARRAHDKTRHVVA
jgi:hypothetical protein